MEKSTRPSRRKDMAFFAVQGRGVSIALACLIFMLSESCYRYERQLSDENAEIADWLARLTWRIAHGALACAFCILAM